MMPKTVEEVAALKDRELDFLIWEFVYKAPRCEMPAMFYPSSRIDSAWPLAQRLSYLSCVLALNQERCRVAVTTGKEFSEESVIPNSRIVMHHQPVFAIERESAPRAIAECALCIELGIRE